MSEWKPIETALKDTRILVHDGEDVGMACFNDDERSKKYGEWVVEWPVCNWKYAKEWMPLPKPPNKKHHCIGDLIGLLYCTDNLNEPGLKVVTPERWFKVKVCPFCGKK